MYVGMADLVRVSGLPGDVQISAGLSGLCKDDIFL